jgi:hypothetical protein
VIAAAVVAGGVLGGCAGRSNPDPSAAAVTNVERSEPSALVTGSLLAPTTSAQELPATSAPTTSSSPASTTSPSANASPAATEVFLEWQPNGDPGPPAEVVDNRVTSSSIGELDITLVRSAQGTDLAGISPVVVDSEEFVALSDGQLLMSSDAVTWQPVDSPFAGRLLWFGRTAPGQFELTLATPDGVVQRWRSGDLRRWNVHLDSAEVALFTDLVDGPGLVGAEVVASITLPDGSTLVNVDVALDLRGQIAARTADLDTRSEFAAHGSERWWEPDPGGVSGRLCAAVITVRSWATCDEAKAESVAFVDVELSITGAHDAWVIDVVDSAGGTALGAVRGSVGGDDLRSILETMTTGDLGWFVIDDGVGERVEPDWADRSDPHFLPGFTVTPDGLLAYESLGSLATDEIDIWRTTDGRSWDHVSGDGRRQQTSDSTNYIHASPAGGLVATVFDVVGSVTILRSDDGVAWRPSTQPPVSIATPDPDGTEVDPIVRVGATDRGFVYFFERGVQRALWTSPDGDTWEEVDLTGFGSAMVRHSDPFFAGGGYGSAVDQNLVTVSIWSTAGTDTQWTIAVG